jgi:hypothetical protein
LTANFFAVLFFETAFTFPDFLAAVFFATARVALGRTFALASRRFAGDLGVERRVTARELERLKVLDAALISQVWVDRAR